MSHLAFETSKISKPLQTKLAPTAFLVHIEINHRNISIFAFFQPNAHRCYILAQNIFFKTRNEGPLLKLVIFPASTTLEM